MHAVTLPCEQVLLLATSVLTCMCSEQEGLQEGAGGSSPLEGSAKGLRFLSGVVVPSERQHLSCQEGQRDHMLHVVVQSGKCCETSPVGWVGVVWR